MITNPRSKLTLVDTETLSVTSIKDSENNPINAGVYTMGKDYEIYYAEHVSIKTLKLSDVKVERRLKHYQYNPKKIKM